MGDFTVVYEVDSTYLPPMRLPPIKITTWGTRIRNVLNIALKKSLPWAKKHYGILLFLILSILLTSNAFKDYYSPISYDIFEVGEDSIRPFPQYYLKVRFSTPQAFLPYENIKVQASLIALAPQIQKMVDTCNAIGLLFDGSEYTKNKINADQIFPYDKDKPFEEQKAQSWPFLTEDIGSVKLSSKGKSPQVQQGQSEIMYRNGDEYLVTLVFGNKKNNHDYRFFYQKNLRHKMRIGSATDLLAKKTNNLLYILTVVNILFIIFITFREKN